MDQSRTESGAPKLISLSKRPFAAGSASDTTGRVVLDQVSQNLGQPMVVEVRPGAGGILGFAQVAKADPDGYTLVTSSSSMATESVLHRKLAYDPVRDFIPVAMFGVQPNDPATIFVSTASGIGGLGGEAFAASPPVSALRGIYRSSDATSLRTESRMLWSACIRAMRSADVPERPNMRSNTTRGFTSIGSGVVGPCHEIVLM